MTSAGSVGRKPFARSASSGGFTKGGAGGNVGGVRLVEGLRCDEILRGLGVDSTPQEGAEVDVCEEEVNTIWRSEQARITKDIKTKDMVSSKEVHDVFTDAFEL